MSKVVKSEEEWQSELSNQEYEVLRKAATELPFTGKYLELKEEGVYVCKACGQNLFSSEAKFESGTGWPSFNEVIEKSSVRLRRDSSLGVERVEVLCTRCDSHLGHLFLDGPFGVRYCINSIAMDFERSEK